MHVMQVGPLQDQPMQLLQQSGRFSRGLYRQASISMSVSQRICECTKHELLVSHSSCFLCWSSHGPLQNERVHLQGCRLHCLKRGNCIRYCLTWTSTMQARCHEEWSLHDHKDRFCLTLASSFQANIHGIWPGIGLSIQGVCHAMVQRPRAKPDGIASEAP